MAAKKMYINGVEINAKLIPDLTALTAVEVTDTTKKSIPVADEDSPNDEAKRMLLSELADLISDGAGVKVYEALLTQSGTDAPTATILRNTLGVVPTLSYVSPGIYRLNASGAFDENKTIVMIGTGETANPTEQFIVTRTDNYIIILTTSINFTTKTYDELDELLNYTPIQIKIYP
jgi:hypothetical protein